MPDAQAPEAAPPNQNQIQVDPQWILTNAAQHMQNSQASVLAMHDLLVKCANALGLVMAEHTRVSAELDEAKARLAAADAEVHNEAAAKAANVKPARARKAAKATKAASNGKTPTKAAAAAQTTHE